MSWSHYIASFFAGIFLANAIPHYVYGVCGDRFPTPFSKPPSPTVNVVWALLNLAVGYILFRVGKVFSEDTLTLTVFFIGVAVISTISSANFAKKHTS